MPIIQVLKNLCDTYMFFNDTNEIAQKNIKESMKYYSYQKKKGLIINFEQSNHKHKFNMNLDKKSYVLSLNKQNLNHTITKSYFSQPSNIIYIYKCDHSNHFACTNLCYVCDYESAQEI
ncbi:hypothetical protein C923_01890 [Plasmodium falciparum UGT5.1]|nr:hypothetical protein PFUGPA_00917 [Plasmodium falciparum Palo Alto/Uganda]EWC77430.1 hypothetical protein C923_01890 [Plasmodium falciparum UGT5.1]EWC89294.1 hypothetical protein PFNF54_01859 [Plasmodium falciparum NF54]